MHFYQKKPFKIWLAICSLVCLQFGQALAQDSTSSAFVAPLFEGDEIISMKISTNIKTLLKDRGEERKSHPALLSYVATDGTEVELPIKLKVRGNFRRQKRNCGFPPLRVNFDKDSVAGTIFAHQDKIKLVTHCQSSRKGYEQYVVLEYLIYKMYQQITDSSFKARMVRVKYEDTSGKNDTIEKLGFFIEDEEQLAMRMGGRILEIPAIHPDQTNYKMVNDLSIFEYMIGNTDFSVAGAHNVKLVLTSPSEPPIAVPYDFDWSGLVDAPYALPNPMLPISSIQERIFRGFCRTEAEFEASFEMFREKKDTFFAMIQDNEYLEDKTKKSATKYLEEFYETINKPSSVQREFIKGCRTDN